METLKQDILQSIRRNPQIMGDLAVTLDKSIETVIRYIRTKDPILTTKSCLDVIRKGLNKKNNEVITEVQKAEKA